MTEESKESTLQAQSSKYEDPGSPEKGENNEIVALKQENALLVNQNDQLKSEIIKLLARLNS